MSESQLQAKIIKWLKSKGCYVIKHSAGPGVPSGCPDLSAYYDGCVIFIEVKASKTSKFQPLQKPTLEKLEDWFKYVYVAYPGNWEDIKAELQSSVF